MIIPGLFARAASAEQEKTFVNEYLGVSVEEVRANFERFDLLDERTRFVEGWFRDTIPKAKVDLISVLPLDGDLYESTWLVLDHFYPEVSPDGFVSSTSIPCRPAKRWWTIFAHS